MKFPLPVALLLCLALRLGAELPSTGLFARTNLVAWCIVPFDTAKRGPTERAEMLRRLGIRRLAYDWRAEHVPTFDAEVDAMRSHGIEITAWWFPAALNAEARAILDVIGRKGLQPQLWVMLGAEPETDPGRLARKIDSAAATLAPVCVEAAKLGCQVALYNHLGWFGEPTNQVAVLDRLRAAGHTNAGIVYNFHHGHAHIASFDKVMAALRPHLLALNLNGMVRDGEATGRKIIPLGTGDEEARMIRIVAGSGWSGPVGIIGHTQEDAEVKLRAELAGLEKALSDTMAARAGVPKISGRDPGAQAEADWADNRWQNSDVGPFLASNVRLPDGQVVAKGLTVSAGDGAVLYDTASGQVRAAWTGGFLKFDPSRFGLIGSPRPAGKVFLEAPGTRDGTPLRYVGLRLGKGGPVLEHEAAGARILERPELLASPFGPVVLRRLEIGPRLAEISLVAAGHLGGTNIGTHFVTEDNVRDGTRTSRKFLLGYNDAGGTRSGFAILGAVPAKAVNHVDDKGGRVVVAFQAGDAPARIAILLWRGDKSSWPSFMEHAKGLAVGESPDVAPFFEKPDVLTTRGRRGTDTAFLTVDTLTMPYENPHGALLFASGVDFTPDGTGYVCTMHGDVWRVTGVDEALDVLRWNRFATGLFQPLGLKVRDGKVFVLGRDRITRLHDANGDGVAEFQENFHDGIDTSTGGHDYVACLETDAAGNFYHVDPKGLHRVSADGGSRTTLATGFRNPNGMGVSPDGQVVTVAPQQGEWTPSSEIIEARTGRWYGYGGPKDGVNPPLGRDLPLCWIPHGVDNSSGSQAWIPEGRWGPLGGAMVHLLWGRCGMMLVLRDTSGPVTQGAVVPLPAKFLAGPNRATFNPRDGHLYVAGSTGWQTSAVRDGAVQRVRYTGRPMRLPVAWKQDGDTVEFSFAEKLDAVDAADAGAYAVKRWNYRYSREYGSPDLSVKDPAREGRDPVEVRSARVAGDGRTLRLRLADARPAMQYELRYDVAFSSGGSERGQLWFTVHPR